MIFVETAMTVSVINGFLSSLAPVVPGQIMLFNGQIARGQVLTKCTALSTEQQLIQWIALSTL